MAFLFCFITSSNQWLGSAGGCKLGDAINVENRCLVIESRRVA